MGKGDAALVSVRLNGSDVTVWVDPENGPLADKPGGGSQEFMVHALGHEPPGTMSRLGAPHIKVWRELTTTEKEVHVILAAKRNRSIAATWGSGNPPESAAATSGASDLLTAQQ